MPLFNLDKTVFYLIFFQVLPVVDGSIWLLSFYNNILACILFIPLIIFMNETPSIMKLISDGDMFFWIMMVISGLFGFAIGYVTGLQIQVSSLFLHCMTRVYKMYTCITSLKLKRIFESKIELSNVEI